MIWLGFVVFSLVDVFSLHSTRLNQSSVQSFLLALGLQLPLWNLKMERKEHKLPHLNFFGEPESAGLAYQYCVRSFSNVIVMSRKQTFTET